MSRYLELNQGLPSPSRVCYRNNLSWKMSWRDGCSSHRNFICYGHRQVTVNRWQSRSRADIANFFCISTHCGPEENRTLLKDIASILRQPWYMPAHFLYLIKVLLNHCESTWTRTKISRLRVEYSGQLSYRFNFYGPIKRSARWYQYLGFFNKLTNLILKIFQPFFLKTLSLYLSLSW